MPYAETAYFGDGESGNILHYGAVRIRAIGTGKLRMDLVGLDSSTTETLLPLNLSSAPGRELTRTANFQGQRAKLRVETTKINEYLKADRIVMFSKHIWTSYPQTE